MARASRVGDRLSSRHPLVRRVERFLGRYALLSAGEAVLVAVSGGADSVFLARALHALAVPRGLALEVAHFNHRWRGAESEADAEFVAQFAKELGLPFHLGVAFGARAAQKSPEEAAREDRYRFLSRLARDRAAAAVAIGHTLDDQLETYLIGWLRGSGPAGASLMAPLTPLPVAGAAGATVVRPLLGVERAEIRAALARTGCEWREDRSNEDPRFLRNRVRAELVPLLESLAPGARKTILRAAALSRDAATYLHGVAAREAGHIFVSAGVALVAERAAFLALEPALRAPVLLQAVSTLIGSAQDVESAHLASACALIARGAGARRTSLGPGAELQLSRGTIRLMARPAPETKSR